MYHDLTTGNDWPVKEAIVDLPNEMKGNLKRTSGNSLSLLGGGGVLQKGDIGQAALQALDYVCDAGYQTMTLFNTR